MPDKMHSTKYAPLLLLADAFGRIPDDLAQNLWSGDIDDEIEKEQLRSVAKDVPSETISGVMKLFKGISTGKDEEVEAFWAFVTGKDLPVRKLVALLFAVIENEGMAEVSFVAAKAYIHLLQIKGSNLRSIFHTYLFRMVFNLLKDKSNTSSFIKSSIPSGRSYIYTIFFSLCSYCRGPV